MDTAMTQNEIQTAKADMVKAHGAVASTYGIGDSIVYVHTDGARARLTYSEQARGWVFAAV